MTAPAQESTGTIAVEMERLRGTLGTGLAEIKGSLALLVQRAGQTDQAMGQHRDQIGSLERRSDALETATAGMVTHAARIAALERWMWVAIGGCVVIGAVAGWVISIVVA